MEVFKYDVLLNLKSNFRDLLEIYLKQTCGKE